MTAATRRYGNASLGVAESTADWESISGRDDPGQRFQIRRLCLCEACSGSGRDGQARCPVCRGEGRTLDLVATAGTPEAVGAALVQLGREGEFEDCPLGLIDVLGEKGQKWLVRPWSASPREESDAGRVLGKASARKRAAKGA